jgi:hypothetical protein
MSNDANKKMLNVANKNMLKIQFIFFLLKITS